MEQKGRSHAGAGGREGAVWCKEQQGTQREPQAGHPERAESLTWIPSSSLLMHQKLSASMLRSMSWDKLVTSKFSTSSSVKQKVKKVQRFSLKKWRKSLVSSTGPLRPGGSQLMWGQEAGACPSRALARWAGVSQEGARESHTTLDRPFLTPGWLSPTHLSLPLHFSFSLRGKTKKLQASCSMSYIQPPGDGLEKFFISEIQWTNILPLMGSENSWDQGAPTGPFKDRIPPFWQGRHRASASEVSCVKEDGPNPWKRPGFNFTKLAVVKLGSAKTSIL